MRRIVDSGEYFRNQLSNNDEFFRRFGSEPDWRGRTVLDFGCGHGAMAIRAALGGAERVLGLDLDRDRIDFAIRNLAQGYPDLADRVFFECADVAEISEQFDLVVSKDTFEHVDDPESVLACLAGRLTAPGELWVGFSPLFSSPYGDHDRLCLIVPWLHTLPWRLVRPLSSLRVGKRLLSLSDVGLNGITPAQFRAYTERAALRVTAIRYNRGSKVLLPFLSLLRHVPGLERYSTVSIYARMYRMPSDTHL